MLSKKYLFFIALVLIGLLTLLLLNKKNPVNKIAEKLDPIVNDSLHPLSITSLRNGIYPGSDLIIEETLTPGINYKRYIASYKSENLKIFGLLTVPTTKSPDSGFPIIIFNHGFIQPQVYRTIEKYVAYQNAFAKSGYVTFKSDYRGHGNSEGEATGGYGSNAYTIDVLNALVSLKKFEGVNPDKIGMWGHSMGGSITLKSMVVSKDIKAGVIWAGVVGSYPDLLNNWHRRIPTPADIPESQRRWRQDLLNTYGTPENNPEFWNSISPTNFLADISGPLQLHHGTNDASVPIEFSKKLDILMKENNKEVEFYTYEGDDHNLSKNLSLALNRSVTFFDKYLK